MSGIDPMFTGTDFCGDLNLGPGCGGMHTTLVCDAGGLVDCHSTVECGGHTVMRETHFGQTRLTDFIDPDTGQNLR